MIGQKSGSKGLPDSSGRERGFLGSAAGLSSRLRLFCVKPNALAGKGARSFLVGACSAGLFGARLHGGSGNVRFIELVGVMTGPLPNMRVQRTRSSPSALRSPLTRHPLGHT